MINSLKNIFTSKQIDFAQLKKEGAIILDVRSKAEFYNGHISGSINIPVGELKKSLHKLPNKEKPIIACCASGMRSSSAKKILLAEGYKTVENGGGWASLQTKL